MQFLHYILNENIDSMIFKVFNALKDDNRKGDFIHLTNTDREDLEIQLTDEDIKNTPKSTWKKYVKEKVNSKALIDLNCENSGEEKKIHFI